MLETRLSNHSASDEIREGRKNEIVRKLITSIHTLVVKTNTLHTCCRYFEMCCTQFIFSFIFFVLPSNLITAFDENSSESVDGIANRLMFNDCRHRRINVADWINLNIFSSNPARFVASVTEYWLIPNVNHLKMRKIVVWSRVFLFWCQKLFLIVSMPLDVLFRFTLFVSTAIDNWKSCSFHRSGSHEKALQLRSLVSSSL